MELNRLSILGLTDQFISEKLDKDTYMIEYHQLCEYRQKYSENTSNSDDQILCGTEFQLPFLKSHNIYESFLYSKHIASEFSIWNDEGKKNLSTLFAKIGYHTF